MMRNFGRNLERHGVQYLLISGQATVLYGAATFSEDIDLWVRPTAGNLLRLRRALASLGARVYKLTPPLSAANARKGHGFHFTLPARPIPAYLDVMGRPPRVDSFDRCRSRATLMRTAWGPMPVLSISDLVEVKKTRRHGDYDVISALVRIRLEEAGENAPPSLLSWGLSNGFVAEDLAWMLERFPEAPRAARKARRTAVRRLLAGRRPLATRLERCREALAREMLQWQRLDIAYWKPILRDLRRLRRAGQLLKDGAAVR